MKKLITLLLICLTFLANAQSSSNMNLLGVYDYSNEGSDIWGWYNPTNGQEYALVTLTNGFSCVNVTNPSSPLQEFFINDINSMWRDVKTWGNYAYVTTEANAGLLIVDLTDMTGNTYSHVTQFTNNNGGSVSFTSAHDIYIDENGIAYIFGAASNTGSNPSDGAIFLDVDANPTNPVYLGEWSDEYIHDGMVRGDTMYAGCIDVGKLFVVDVSDKNNPITIGQHATPNNFTHNAWVSDNGDYVFTTDEKPGAYLAAYDVSDLNNIQEVDRIQSNPGSNSIPHNTFVDGNFLITSYYRDGTTVHDITYPNNMIQVAYYDSYSGSGNGFNGCWGTYPFLPSGNIISSDIDSGPNGGGRLLIYSRDFQQASFLSGTVTNINTGFPISNATIEILPTSTMYTTTSNLL
jgi:choice-of-anchor B domain-containing protein